MTKARLGLMPWISNSKFMQPRGALFLSLMVTNCSDERSLSRFKRIEKEMNSRNVPGEVVQSDKLSQTKCNEFLDNFVIKKARIVLCSAYT